MIGAQNLNYYLNFIYSAQDIQQRHKAAGKFRFLMNPVDSLIGFGSSKITNYFLLPPVKLIYSGTGLVVTKTTALVNRSLSNWVENWWYDPISTKNLLRIGRLVQWLTRSSAMATPFKLPIIGVVDRCRIAIARHFYVISKDFNSLLRIPDTLRNYVDWKTIDVTPEDEAEPSTYLQKGWVHFKEGTKLVSNALIALIAKVFALISLPFRKIPYLNVVTTAIAQKIDAARNHIHGSFVKKAHSVIDNNEVKIRRSIMAKIAVISTRTFVNKALNIGIKVLVNKKVYELAQLGYAQAMGSYEIPEMVKTVLPVVLKVASFTLLMHMILPTIEKFHDDYKKDFNAEASTLREFGSLVNRHNLPKVLSFIKKRFT